MSKVNKSHAAGYAILSYRTAYLKANYFLEYSTAVLRSVEGDKKKLTPYANIVKNNGVDIMFPSVNKSNIHMDIYDFDNKIVSTGLLAISGLPEEMANHIVAEREENGLFKNYDDFLKRMLKYHIDKKSITSLAYSGALDEFDKNGDRLVEHYEYAAEVYKKREELSSLKQRSIFDMVSFEPIVDYLKHVPDNNGYNLQERLARLCEYNNVGIHPDVTSSYDNIRMDLSMSRYQRDEDFDNKEGVVTGVLEEEFVISKKGKAYLTTLRVFNGDVYKLIVAKSKVDDVTDDITQYKKGMVVDIRGSFKFPKLEESDSGEGDDTESQGFVNNDIVSFPNDITIKALESPKIRLNLELNLDDMRIDKDYVSNYYGVKSFAEVIKIIFSKPSEEGKGIVVIHEGNRFASNKTFDVSMDMVNKLGCSFRVI